MVNIISTKSFLEIMLTFLKTPNFKSTKWLERKEFRIEPGPNPTTLNPPPRRGAAMVRMEAGVGMDFNF